MLSVTGPSLRILFMGSSSFAVPSLAALEKTSHTIVGVFTAPDKPQGRGKHLGTSAVKQYAESRGLAIYQPPRLRAPEVQTLLKSLRPDLQIVVAFRKLPQQIWDFPAMGSVNLHASLLPAYRGAAPIHWALIRGEKQTGITTFFITEQIDTGPILLQAEVAIAADDTLASLHDRMSQQGADLLLRTVAGLAEGKLVSRPQASALAEMPVAPKIDRSNCEINWQLPAQQIQNLVRGLAPQPGAWTLLNGKTCKLFRVRSTDQPHLAAGEHLLCSEGLFFGSSTETLSVEDLQWAGKKRLLVADFLRGMHL